jgi:hypothetical protein
MQHQPTLRQLCNRLTDTRVKEREDGWKTLKSLLLPDGENLSSDGCELPPNALDTLLTHIIEMVNKERDEHIRKPSDRQAARLAALARDIRVLIEVNFTRASNRLPGDREAVQVQVAVFLGGQELDGAHGSGRTASTYFVSTTGARLSTHPGQRFPIKQGVSQPCFDRYAGHFIDIMFAGNTGWCR